MGTEPLGLRESKKQETRQLISDHATRLFIENGFESTTIAEIAAAARVAKKTVTNYFALKEDLAFDRQEEFVTGLARTVSGRAVGESALVALRRAFFDSVERQDPVIGFSGEVFARMITESPTLLARLREMHDQREGALAELLSTETGAGPEDITPRAAAAQLGSAHRVLFQQTLELTLDGHDNERIAEMVSRSAHRVFELLRGPLAGYAVK
ncbi:MULTISPECIES: TetR/AcrR family transcriptional regulator [unclassified Streptomyces]|uniref:TetR/AcrR family transcriptional regulator n=1 Tax=unclassified Streptomyces TaxID=2593676 RepID=UPI001BEB24BC|nr:MULTISPECIES: TetR family transcriptional regulator [unclassified Streptomyces]MBT2406196.1 TetR family transcriptional regulator [Streptomyces sp. ISL-21]MBT2459021.1 TetR family transcriptional regulator [Streptomyces sp. ISL-86]MBT2609496.1 TetR family transcriptional regulator [Streptomyces sp. ISL-87]